jgi:hypothetical protein
VAFTGAINGQKVFFRVVVGDKDYLLNGRSEWVSLDALSPCRAVSISMFLVEAALNCVCPTPSKFSIGSDKIISNKIINACQDETVMLNVPGLSPNVELHWFKSETQPAADAIPDHIGNTFYAVGSEAGMERYFVRLVDANDPEATNCWRFDDIQIRLNITPPARNIEQTWCLENPTPLPTETIPFSFQSTYATNGKVSEFILYPSPTSKIPIVTALGSPIQVAAGASATNLIVQGNQVELNLVPDGANYYVYLEDVTKVPAQGVLLPSAIPNNASTVNARDVRIFLDVTQEITLHNVKIFPRGNGGNSTPVSASVTPVIYLANADGTVGAARVPAITATAQPFTYRNDIKTDLIVNLHDYVLPPGR